MNRVISGLALLFALCVSAKADDYIVILLDTSGSMSQPMSDGKNRMQIAQDALIEVLSQVPDTTNVGIITFKGWIYPLGPVNRAKLSNAIRSTVPKGNTPLYAYLSTAATDLLKKRKAQGNIGFYKLLVVTDGEAGDVRLNQDTKYPDGSPKIGVLQDIIQRGIVVDTIGLDMPGDHSLSQLINGAYMSGNNPQSLTEAVTKAVAEISFGAGPDTSEEAFAEIGEIPESFAMATILGLTTYSNHPIGQRALESVERNQPPNQPTASTGGNRQTNQSLPSSRNAPNAQQNPDGPQEDDSPGILWIAALAIGILWVLSLFKKARKRHVR
jgi:hypothetical protein